MLAPDTLVARTTAVLVSRRHNADIYALRGCEELDSHYRILEKILSISRLKTYSADETEKLDPENFYKELLGKIESNAAFAAKLDAWFTSDYPSKFGQLVAYVLSNWDQLPEKQRNLAEEGERWIAAATASWPDDFREAMRGALVHTARRLYLFTNLWLLRRLARLLDPKRLDEARDFPGMAFSAVLDEEMEEIEKRRGTASTTPDAGQPQERADQADLAGLAFSGGGIRSATFNLGVLQGLAEDGLLRRFDYLSTVSGGGYIGSWLHAWIHRSDQPGKGGIGHVEECLAPSQVPDPQDERAAPIRFLRRYSNYLTPQTGFMSADTWTMLNIWLRNTFLNVLILALALSGILLAPRWMASASDTLNNDWRLTEYWWALLIPPAFLIGLNLLAFHARFTRVRRAWFCKERAILLFIVAPIFLAAWGAGTIVPNLMNRQPKFAKRLQEVNRQVAKLESAAAQHPNQQQAAQELSDLRKEQMQLWLRPEANMSLIISQANTQFAWVTATLVLLVSVVGRLDLSFYPGRTGGLRWLRTMRAYSWILGVCLTAYVACWTLDYLWWRHVVKPLWMAYPESRDSRAILTGSAPAFLFLLSIAIFLNIGLLGRRLPDDRREWTARLGGWLAICCIGWVALCGTAADGPRIVVWLAGWTRNQYVGEGGLGAVWIMITAAGVFAARATTKNAGKSGAGIPVSLIAKVAPPVFVAGLLLLLSYALGLSGKDDGWAAFFLSVFCLGLAAFLSRRVDINEFSLHQFYRNRLVRCYLGGARAGDRQPNPFTGFDAMDDFPVHDLSPSGGYSGPYPIFNATLNVTHGDELAWQERKGESFVFTPRFSGFDVAHGRATHSRTGDDPRLSYGGYRPTRDYAYPDDGGVSVGTAVAISGAAASPNQGRQTSAATAFLMTVMDLRLGWWLGNPRRTDTWRKPGPTTGLFQLMAELTASTSDTGKYVSLSDGGHFENLAIYELVRRRCRYIVACDAEQDQDYSFGGLGNAVRKCRTDFGVEIEIVTTGLKPAKDGRFTGEHCVVGKIHYPAVAGGTALEGTLIYIKSSLTGNESADVLQYSVLSPRFPQESTADQWFGEAQFESYRKLGYHAAESASPRFGGLRVPAVPFPPKDAAAEAG